MYILLSFGTRPMNMWFNILLLLRWLPVMWRIFSALVGILLPSGICQVLPPLKLHWHAARCGWILPSRSLPCTGSAAVLLSGLYDLFCTHCDRLCLWRQNIQRRKSNQWIDQIMISCQRQRFDLFSNVVYWFHGRLCHVQVYWINSCLRCFSGGLSSLSSSASCFF